jgi:arylsulfatase A-like enzyme
MQLRSKVKREMAIELNSLSKKQLADLIDQYDGAINYVDFQLGRLIKKLKDEKLFDNTLIIITSDHGEQFKEHGGLLHETFFEELIRVPLIFSCPALLPKGIRRKQLVRHIDILPTILELMQLSKPSSLDGTSLQPIIFDDSDLDLQALILADNGSCLRSDSWKYFETVNLCFPKSLKIINASFKAIPFAIIASLLRIKRNGFKIKTKHLFDLKNDPKEKNNLARSKKKLVQQLRQQLKNNLKAQVKSEDIVLKKSEKKAVAERLQALGYID